MTWTSYAIPTKGFNLEPLSLDEIKIWVVDFIKYARQAHETIFLVTPIGTGLAGYTHDQIAPMFKDTPDNCVLPAEWKELLS